MVDQLRGHHRRRVSYLYSQSPRDSSSQRSLFHARLRRSTFFQLHAFLFFPAWPVGFLFCVLLLFFSLCKLAGVLVMCLARTNFEPTRLGRFLRPLPLVQFFAFLRRTRAAPPAPLCAVLFSLSPFVCPLAHAVPFGIACSRLSCVLLHRCVSNMATAASLPSPSSECRLCTKTFNSSASLQRHLDSKAHLRAVERARAADAAATAVAPASVSSAPLSLPPVASPICSPPSSSLDPSRTAHSSSSVVAAASVPSRCVPRPHAVHSPTDQPSPTIRSVGDECRSSTQRSEGSGKAEQDGQAANSRNNSSSKNNQSHARGALPASSLSSSPSVPSHGASARSSAAAATASSVFSCTVCHLVLHSSFDLQTHQSGKNHAVAKAAFIRGMRAALRYLDVCMRMAPQPPSSHTDITVCVLSVVLLSSGRTDGASAHAICAVRHAGACPLCGSHSRHEGTQRR